MAMREHKEATTQEIPCVVASFFISWHRQVETPGQISRRSYRPLGQSKSQANRLGSSGSALVGDGGFEPPKALPADLQSVPFGHSGNPPYIFCFIGGAGGRTRTPDLLITNQLLYQLSYTSLLICFLSTDVLYYIISKTDCQEFFKNFLIFLLSASSAFAVP